MTSGVANLPFGSRRDSHKSLTIILLILLLPIVMNLAQVEALPQSNMINVPYHLQETPYYCTPAAVQMALQYVSGKLVSQKELATEMHTTPTNGTVFGGTSILEDVVPFLDRNFSNVIGIHGSSDDLKLENSAGYATILAIWSDSSHITGHSILVIGYNATGFFYHDPGLMPDRFIKTSDLLALWAYSVFWYLEIPYPPSSSFQVLFLPITWFVVACTLLSGLCLYALSKWRESRWVELDRI